MVFKIQEDFKELKNLHLAGTVNLAREMTNKKEQENGLKQIPKF